jgi:hypothetical protein
MIKQINTSTLIEAQGDKPKIVEEFIGRMNIETQGVSIA